jgi:hypothetical protein
MQMYILPFSIPCLKLMLLSTRDTRMLSCYRLIMGIMINGVKAYGRRLCMRASSCNLSVVRFLCVIRKLQVLCLCGGSCRTILR